MIANCVQNKDKNDCKLCPKHEAMTGGWWLNGLYVMLWPKGSTMPLFLGFCSGDC